MVDQSDTVPGRKLNEFYLLLLFYFDRKLLRRISHANCPIRPSLQIATSVPLATVSIEFCGLHDRDPLWNVPRQHTTGILVTCSYAESSEIGALC